MEFLIQISVVQPCLTISMTMSGTVMQCVKQLATTVAYHLWVLLVLTTLFRVQLPATDGKMTQVKQWKITPVPACQLGDQNEAVAGFGRGPALDMATILEGSELVDERSASTPHCL